ncbi:LamG domain-containing protein [Lacinutrix iliipiscaria]|uniref:LamG domain-containing protein n=1 Tax=Lacinutrix iliipiscaria TaxID=1230532 RepID=A0ABW5WLP5_9FLAO
MKAFNFKKLLFLPLFFLLLFASCQEEAVEVTSPDDEETIAPDSNLANLMRNTAANDGSFDNIIDFASCLEVELPVTVVVDGVEIIINSEDDFDLIEAIFDEFDGDEDTLEILFPITIILSDYTEIVIENQDALEEYIRACGDENEYDDDIECIDFQYPISISIYNTDFEIIDTVTITSDAGLYAFIESLEGGVLASINFPVTMILANGDVIEVANNTELENVISEAEDDCDEDDDNDWDDDDIEDCDVNLAGLESLLLECNIIASVYDNSGNIIDMNYLDFNSDGEVIVNGTPAVTEVGTWGLSEFASGYVLTISGLVTFDLLNGEWLLDGCDGDNIILSLGTGSTMMTMQLEQDCRDVPDCSESFVVASLTECYWYAETNLFDIFVPEELYFSIDGTVDVYNSETNELTTSGTWSINSDPGTGNLYLIPMFNEEPFSMLTASWEMIECDENRFEFVNGDNTLVLEQVCEDCDNPGTLTNDLIIYMPFSNEANDLISGRVEEVSNDFVEDRAGNSTCAIAFSGSDNFSIPVTDQNQLIQGDSFTISLWFKMQNSEVGDLEIFFRSPGDATQGFNLGVYDLNSPLFFDNLGFSVWDNDWNSEVDVVWDNTDWHHLVATVDSDNTVRLYRDGILRNVIEDSDFSVGSEPSSMYIIGEDFVGHLDDLRVYKRTISSSEVEQLYELEGDCYTCL